MDGRRRIYTQRDRDRQQDDLISLLSFFKLRKLEEYHLLGYNAV
jgi:hypothetical protein